ncbi:MAG: kinase/pyrophosphorylase [Anaerolineales bacterium]
MIEEPIFHLLTDVPHLDPAMLLEPVLMQIASRAQPRLYRYPPAQFDAHIQRVLVAAQADGGIVVHALVDERLRSLANELSHTMDVPSIDLVGPMVARLTELLDLEQAA